MNTRKNFITVGHIEGVSYLVLLLIAMPLKYIWQMPMAVNLVGYLHGALFVLYSTMLLIFFLKKQVSFKQSFIAMLLSLLPFGTFFLDKNLPKF